MRVMNLSRIGQLEKSMRLHGQLQPVVARVHENGVQMIDGFKRLYASEALMMDTLQCRLLDVDLPQAKVLLLSYNRSHQSMEAWEEAVVLKDLLETHDLDQRRLAKLTGYSSSWVSRRLSLIGKIDEEVVSEIRMGILSSSHARSLIRLPRGNQAEVARAITTHHLTSRQSDIVVDALMEAVDKNQQRSILVHPERVLAKRAPGVMEKLYDPRLCSYGNDLQKSISLAIYGLRVLFSHLGDQRFDKLDDIERSILTPDLKKVSGYAKRLVKITGPLLHHKSK